MSLSIGPTGPTGPAGPSIPGPTGPTGPVGNPESVTWFIRRLGNTNGPIITSSSISPTYKNGLLATDVNSWFNENGPISTQEAYFVLPQTSSRAVFEFNIKYLLPVSPGPIVGPTSFIFYNNADTALDPTTAGWSQVVQSNPPINSTSVSFTYNYMMLTANGLLNIPQSVMESATVSNRTVSISCLSSNWDSNYKASETFYLGPSFSYTNSNTIIAIRRIQ